MVFWYGKKIGIQNGIPYEDDLYLDVVLVPDGRIHLLDEDELDDAYKKREINQKEFDMAYRVANEIIEKYQEKDNIEKLKDFSNKYLEKIKTSKSFE